MTINLCARGQQHWGVSKEGGSSCTDGSVAGEERSSEQGAAEAETWEITCAGWLFLFFTLLHFYFFKLLFKPFLFLSAVFGLWWSDEFLCVPKVRSFVGFERGLWLRLNHRRHLFTCGRPVYLCPTWPHFMWPKQVYTMYGPSPCQSLKDITRAEDTSETAEAAVWGLYTPIHSSQAQSLTDIWE